MTDRDTFAAAALTGYNANPAWDDVPASIVAEQAYGDADAMLRARNRAAAACETAGPAPVADGTGWPTSGAGPALTDEEREAISLAYGRLTADANYKSIAATLKALLERLK